MALESVPGHTPSAHGAGLQRGAGRVLPLAVLLALLVILAAGIGGTSNFTGPRWYPKVNEVDSRPRTGLIVGPTTKLKGGLGHRTRTHSYTVPEWVIVIGVVAVAMLVLALIWRWWKDRRLPAPPAVQGAHLPQPARVVEAKPEPEPERLLTGIELALRVLDEQREPADAVVRAWLGLQETAEQSGVVRFAAETPAEFTTRILGSVFSDDRALRTLLSLYLRTRFGDHPVTGDDVTKVREALSQLLASWQQTAGAR